jgi:hypothetical protein
MHATYFKFYKIILDAALASQMENHKLLYVLDATLKWKIISCYRKLH